MFFVIMQVPVTLVEYSVNAITKRINSTASTRVLVRGNDDYASFNTSNGQTVNRTVRYEIYMKYCFPLIYPYFP